MSPAEDRCMDQTAQRRDRLAAGFATEGIDALLVSSPVNVTYLTGFTGDSSVLVLTRDRAVLVSDRRYTDQIAEECPSLETAIRPPTQKLPDAAAGVLNGLGLRNLGFESGALTVADLEALRGLAPSLNWKGGGDRVEKWRLVKDASELARIRGAIDVAERAYTVLRSLLRAEDSEKDLCDALEGYIRRAGGECSSFPPLVAVGERAALPHAPPTARRVGDGELLLVDWGASAAGYKSDLTRTLGVRKISSKLEQVYGVVLAAQEAAIRAVRPGVQAQAIDAEARGVIAQAGLAEAFGHGLGHGIGLQIHEGPALRPGSETLLQAGMVFTIEPGVYLPDWGGVRIEDDVLVTPDGCEVLTHAPRGLEALTWA
jgi:Xaa-Pro aminopeptidase